jgi:ABC-type spermidine/putrescine transport system permease subunit II
MAIVVLAELQIALTAWNSGNMCFLVAHIFIAIALVTAYAVVHRKQISEA